MLVGSGIDELHDEADAITGAPHAPFQDRADSERLSDFAHVVTFAAIRQHGRARDHFQLADVRKRGEHVIVQTVSKEGVFGVAAEIVEWQHRD